MKATEVAKKLSKETGIHITLSRINRYEERGILPSPPRKGSRKDYTTDDIERLRKVIILSELGVPLPRIRAFFLGLDIGTNMAWIDNRILEVKLLLKLWEER